MNKSVKTLLSLLIVSAVSLGALFGSDLLTRTLLEEQQSSAVGEIFGELLPAQRYEEISAEGWDTITAAYLARDGEGHVAGYALTVTVDGYGGKIEVHTALSADGTQVKGIRIGSHNETAGYGARITNVTFTEQFQNTAAPLFLAGTGTGLKDGVYRATAKADNSGFRDTVEVTVSGGEITAANWDAENENGDTKKQLSKAGQYVMSETGLPWHEQASIMEQALLYTQDPAKLVYDPETGKTDAYTGATIQVSPFITLAKQALEQAGGVSKGNTPIDGLSGATTSSKAVIAAVNTAADFAAHEVAS